MHLEAPMPSFRTKLKPYVSAACWIAFLVLVDWGWTHGMAKVNAGLDGLSHAPIVWSR